MTELLIGVSILLFVVLMGLVYRVFTLASVARRSTQAGKTSEAEGKPRTTASNAVNGFLFIAFFFIMFGLIFSYSGTASENFLPDAASAHGGEIDYLFWLTTAITFAVFFLTHCLLFFFPYMYRFKTERKAKFYPHNNTLELIWTVIPAVALTLLVVSGWFVWSDVTAPAPEDAFEIEIMGKQFNWQTRYGGKDGVVGPYDFKQIDATNSMGIDLKDPKNMDDFTATTLILPKGKNVKLRIRSRDVLHSVFLPHFRVKMDAVPGMPTQFWFQPTLTTKEMREKLREEGKPNADEFNYELACTEICGSAHFSMKMKVEVLSEEEFDKWYAEQESWASKNKAYLEEKGIKVLASN